MDAAPTASESSTLFERLTNVITDPGEVFTEIKATPVKTSNWLVPLVLVCFATAFYFVMAFSQPGVTNAMKDQREKAMQKQVASGKLTQAQADQASAMAEKFTTPTLMKIFSIGGAVFSSTVGLFMMGLGIWLGIKFCTEASVEFMKVVEICGLALVIDVLQKILRTWLVIWKENLLATASPTLFLANPSVNNKTDVFLSMLDVVDLWWLAVISLGISKVASVRYGTAAAITFGVWFGFRIVMALLTPSS